MIEAVIQKELPDYSHDQYGRYEFSLFWAELCKSTANKPAETLKKISAIIIGFDWPSWVFIGFLHKVIDGVIIHNPHLFPPGRFIRNGQTPIKFCLRDVAGNVMAFDDLLEVVYKNLNDAQIQELNFVVVAHLDHIIRRWFWKEIEGRFDD